MTRLWYGMELLFKAGKRRATKKRMQVGPLCLDDDDAGGDDERCRWQVLASGTEKRLKGERLEDVYATNYTRGGGEVDRTTG